MPGIEVQIDANLLIQVLQEELSALNARLMMQMAINRQLQGDKTALQEQLFSTAADRDKEERPDG